MRIATLAVTALLVMAPSHRQVLGQSDSRLVQTDPIWNVPVSLHLRQAPFLNVISAVVAESRRVDQCGVDIILRDGHMRDSRLCIDLSVDRKPLAEVLATIGDLTDSEFNLAGRTAYCLSKRLARSLIVFQGKAVDRDAGSPMINFSILPADGWSLRAHTVVAASGDYLSTVEVPSPAISDGILMKTATSPLSVRVTVRSDGYRTQQYVIDEASAGSIIPLNLEFSRVTNESAEILVYTNFTPGEAVFQRSP